MNDYKTIEVKDGKVVINFALFKNDNRESENHPNVKFWEKETGISAAAWTKQSKQGSLYQSCVVQIPVEQLAGLFGAAAAATPAPTAAPAPSDDFDDIPF